MIPKFLGLRTVVYKVSDLSAAKDWYSRAFGQEPYFDEPFYIGFNIGGYELGILPVEDNNERPKQDSSYTYWGVEDIDSAYEHLLNIGARIHEAPNNVGGDLMVASVYDPWNNIVGIIYNPYFKLTTDD